MGFFVTFLPERRWDPAVPAIFAVNIFFLFTVNFTKFSLFTSLWKLDTILFAFWPHYNFFRICRSIFFLHFFLYFLHWSNKSSLLEVRKIKIRHSEAYFLFMDCFFSLYVILASSFYLFFFLPALSCSICLFISLLSLILSLFSFFTPLYLY